MGKYKYIIIPFVGLIICQVTKFINESIKIRKVYWPRLFNGAGGMPSTHATFCSSLTSIIGYDLGINNPLFAISLIFSCIVCYDAMGVRFESGKQAEVINDLVEKVEKAENPRRRKKAFKKLKEQLGHKPLEVITGIVLGLLVASFFYTYIF